MVSKMAVIAIVAIVAAPILTGYLMAFEDVERARYNPDDTKNVTDLVMNDSTYTYLFWVLVASGKMQDHFSPGVRFGQLLKVSRLNYILMNTALSK